MDKIYLLPTMTTKGTPQRRGFALIITMSVLSVVIALTIVLLSYFNEVKEDADNTKALIQANVYYADILTQLNKLGKNRKTFFQRLYRFPVSLASPDKRFKLSMACKPLAGGVNINWLVFERQQQKQHLYQVSQVLFETLAQQFQLEDADLLLEMLLLEIGGNKKYVTSPQRRLMQKNGIISYQQFSNIINRYEIEADDLKVARIPWRKYFTFSSKSEKIDVEFSSAELIAFLFDIDLNSVREWQGSIPKISLQSFIEQNGGDYNDRKNLLSGNKFLGESRCSVGYGEGYKFTFDYTAGEAKYFEFYGK